MTTSLSTAGTAGTFQQPAAAAMPAPRDGFFTHHGPWAPGVRLFRRLGFRAKAAIISAAFLLPLCGLLAWQFFVYAELAQRSRVDAVRQQVELAHGVLAWAHAQEQAGQLTREQAQASAKRLVAGLRYGAGEYFWINDMAPRMVMHPTKPELDGRALGDMKDPNGFALFNAFVDVVRRDGQGMVAYQWPRPGADKPVDKVSYVKGFAPWGWVVGSGVYVDDVRQQVIRHLAEDGLVLGLGLALAGYLFGAFCRVMNGGLHEVGRHLRAIAEGDLTTTPQPWGRDEVAGLLHEMQRTQQALRGMVAQVRAESAALVQAAAEIDAGALDLSARTEQAAAALEESAASMEEITATARSSSAHSASAAQVARDNAVLASSGGRLMQDVVTTMDGIRGSSDRIGDIVGTIDAIAFQTNLLALNAAVEAAGAGERGRGFAVVADEVRRLAQRSATAAREIKGLIGQSIGQVGTGTGIVREAAAAMTRVVDSSQRVDRLLGEVATAAHEQSAGIGQIGQAVGELDRMTQHNAALVEQTAASAASLKQRADGLAQAVARFRLPACAG